MVSFKKFNRQNTFKEFVTEARGMLDISIQHANKFLTNDLKKKTYLTTPLVVEHKTDGIKITIMKIANTGVAEKDYIVAYKNDIIYSSEHTYLSKAEIKKSSINNAQFAFVWDHLYKLRKNSVPVGTELFVEYLMSKPTLSSHYKIKHGMVLIGYSKSSYKIKNGKMFTSTTGFFTDKRNEYAKEMKFNVPALLFKGILGTKKEFSKGIISRKLKDLYRASDINWDSTESIILGTSQMFLDVESDFGGVEEGVVIKYDNSNVILKWQQKYQTDQAERAKIKDRYRGSAEYEDEYYKKVNKAIDELQKGIDKSSFSKALLEFNKRLKNYEIPFEHIKKNNIQIREDIALTFRMRLSKDVSSGALIVGKFRVLTRAHYDMIREATKKYDTVTVNIVSSKETKGTKQLRNDVIAHCFPEVEILNGSTGNLYTIMRKSNNEITTVIAGTDRADSYRKMLEKNYGIDVYEIKRTDADISATKVISKLDDYDFFVENTPKCSHKFYDEYLSHYKQGK